VNLLTNLKSVVDATRQSGIRVFVVPHRRWEPGDYTHWKHPTPRQLATAEGQIFAKGTWGGDWHPDFAPQEGDIIIKEHWAQSGFANTDLDQQLKQHGIQKIILIGMLANTCIESTGRAQRAYIRARDANHARAACHTDPSGQPESTLILQDTPES
jgi:nicotinamidase-related amidase